MDKVIYQGKLDRRVRPSEVKSRYGMGHTALYNAIKRKYFPAPHRLPGGRSTFWWESELLDYEKNFKNGL